LCLIARRWQEAPAIDPVLRRLGLANHWVPVMTNHAPAGKPGSVPIARLRRNEMTLDNEQIVRQAYA